MGDRSAYLEAHRTGLLVARAAEAAERLRACDLCPRRCGVDRLAGERGVCRGGARATVCSAGPHFGEEEPLVGRFGSGTIFLAHCNLRCVFCQNWEISHLGHGEELGAQQLAGLMLGLQRQGCHNINFVTPTHFLPQILAAVVAASVRGLEVPLVWNCGGYESDAALRLLEGIVDIYMPDIKFADPAVAKRLCAAPDYFDRAREGLREMHRQVGDLELGPDGIARRGLLVRHLVMPGMLDQSREIFAWLAALSPDTAVNVMAQYRPEGLAIRQPDDYPELARRLSRSDYEAALAEARAAGLRRAASL